MRKKNLVHSSQRGFSLIEIMIVITLMGMIMAFAARNFIASQQEVIARARKSRFSSSKQCLMIISGFAQAIPRMLKVDFRR